MRLFRRVLRTGAAAGLLFGLALLIPLAAGAVSFTLQQVIDNGGFTTGNGVTFSSFSVSITGALSGSIDADDLVLSFEEGSSSAGFTLTGPISAADGEVGDVFLSFAVSTQAGIDGALLSALNVAGGGGGALASVDELIKSIAGASLGLLSTSDTGGPGAPITDAAIAFAPQTSIRVMKDILVDSSILGGGQGGSARISFVQQTFTLAPEPTTLALVLGGLTGLGVFGRKRRAH